MSNSERGCLSGLSETLPLILYLSRCTEFFQKSNHSPILMLVAKETVLVVPDELLTDLRDKFLNCYNHWLSCATRQLVDDLIALFTAALVF